MCRYIYAKSLAPRFPGLQSSPLVPHRQPFNCPSSPSLVNTSISQIPSTFCFSHWITDSYLVLYQMSLFRLCLALMAAVSISNLQEEFGGLRASLVYFYTFSFPTTSAGLLKHAGSTCNACWAIKRHFSIQNPAPFFCLLLVLPPIPFQQPSTSCSFDSRLLPSTHKQEPTSSHLSGSAVAGDAFIPAYTSTLSVFLYQCGDLDHAHCPEA